MNLSDYRALVAGRCQIGTTDPEYAKIPGYISQAVNSYQPANRRGWDFLRRDATLTTTADQQTYPFAVLAALVADNDPTVLYPVRRVFTVAQLYESGQQRQVDRISRYEADQELGASASVASPTRWTAEGRTLYLYPPPNDALDFALRVLLTDAIDATDTDSEPLLPDEYSEVVVELASYYTFRGIRERQAAGDALAAHKVALAAALTDMPYGGPGRPNLEPR